VKLTVLLFAALKGDVVFASWSAVPLTEMIGACEVLVTDRALPVFTIVPE
jgi:hypothetical protein